MCLQPFGDLLAVQLTRAKDELGIALPDGDGVRLPAELVEVALLRARVGERAPSPARANTGEEELCLDGCGGDERHERRQPRLEVVAREVDDRECEQEQAPNPEWTKRHVATMLPVGAALLL